MIVQIVPLSAAPKGLSETGSRTLEILRTIRHPNLLACFGAWRAGDFLVLGMELADGWGGIHPDVVEAAALAHDLGHPPFGHTAEEELNSLVGEAGGEGPRGYSLFG